MPFEQPSNSNGCIIPSRIVRLVQQKNCNGGNEI